MENRRKAPSRNMERWGGLGGLAALLFIYTAMSGLIVANSVAGALAAHPNKAGTASALLGGMHYGSGVLSAAAVGWLADGTPGPMTWIIAAGGVGSLLFVLLLVRPAAPT